MKAIKNFGLGLVWALLFPVIVAGVLVVGVFGLIDFLVEFVIMVVNFFRGNKLFPMYPEDKKAYDILQRAIDKKNMESQAATTPAGPAPVYVQQNFYGVPPGGALPPGASPTPLPPGYGVPPGYGTPIPPGPASSLPPGYGAPLPPTSASPGFTPLPEPDPVSPTRPELASLPVADLAVSDLSDEIGEGDDDE